MSQRLSLRRASLRAVPAGVSLGTVETALPVKVENPTIEALRMFARNPSAIALIASAS